MIGLRPLLACLVSCLLAGPALAGVEAGPPRARPGSPALLPQPEGGFACEGESYRALIGPDGNLHSLRVGDTEMLDDRIAISLGAFFYADGPRKLETITTPGPTVLEATDGTFRAVYRFRRGDVRITLTSQGTAAPYFVVLSPLITVVSNPRTEEAAAAGCTESWGDARFSTEKGAYLELTGGSRIWGPWLGRQVWEVSRVVPGQSVQIRLTAGTGPPPKPTLEQLVGAHAEVAAPDGIVHVDNPILLQVSVENRSDTPLESQVSMELSACRGDQVIYATAPLPLPAKQTAATSFNATVDAPDFYHARITVSALGRELATARAAAGYRVAEIAPKVERPADFRDFWQRLASEVGDEAPDYRLDLMENRSRGEVQVWVARYPSLASKTISGWYLQPQSPGPHPGIVYLSGYGARPVVPPVALAEQGYAVLAIDVRGNAVDRPRPHPFEDYSTIGIDSPNSYVYREIIGHALGAVHLLASRQGVDPRRIAVVGVSEGGGLGLILAALSPQVRAVAADAPMLCDFPLSLRSAAWPYTEIVRYMQRRPEAAAQVTRTLTYFDVVNFAPEIKSPVLLSTGFLDPVSLPAAVYGVFNVLGGPKEIRPYPEAGHEGGGHSLWAYKLDWLKRALATAP